MPTGNAGVTETDEKCDNFTNKFIHRAFLQLVDEPTGITQVAANVHKLQKSNVFTDETLQVIVNNTELFRDGPISKQMTKAGYLFESWGAQNIPLGSNVTAATITKSPVLLTPTSLPLYSVGLLSYYGFTVSKAITTPLQIRYKRTALGGGQASARMNVFCEVFKRLAYTDNGFLILNL